MEREYKEVTHKELKKPGPKPVLDNKQILDLLIAGPKTTREIAEFFGMTRAGVLNYMNRLESAGLVKRTILRGDRSDSWSLKRKARLAQ